MCIPVNNVVMSLANILLIPSPPTNCAHKKISAIFHQLDLLIPPCSIASETGIYIKICIFCFYSSPILVNEYRRNRQEGRGAGRQVGRYDRYEHGGQLRGAIFNLLNVFI
jgi:hypothetical protein